MRLSRKSRHLSIFPTSKQTGLGAIPGSQFQFPLGVKWSTNYIAIGRKQLCISHMSGMHYSTELPHSPGQSEIVTYPSLSLPISSLPFPVPCRPSSWWSLSLFFLSPTKSVSSKSEVRKCTMDWLWLLQAGALLMGSCGYTCQLIVPYISLEHKLFGTGIDSSQTGVMKTAFSSSTRKSMSVPKQKAVYLKLHVTESLPLLQP